MTALEDPRWLALSEERRNALLEKHRDTNVEHVKWFDGVYEQFEEECAEKGICVDRRHQHVVGARPFDEPAIYFSGFWSQGDGACFEGCVNDWPKFLVAAGHPKLVELYEKLNHSLTLNWRHRGHYYHSGCTSFEHDLYVGNPYDAETDVLQYAAWDVATERGDIFDCKEGDFIKYVRGLMDALYKSLEEEHDGLTSDETVAAYILEHCEEELVEDEDELSLEH